MREGTYYASLWLRANGRTIEIDARPSDAIALAVRTQVPIYATDVVLDRAGVIPESDEEERLSVFREFVNSLDVDLGEGPGGPPPEERGGPIH
jgi:hypothetical protein